MEFSNPLPPTSYTQQTSQDETQPLTNEDFRKLMMTPRVGGPAQNARVYQKQSSTNEEEGQKSTADERKKRKLYYAKLKKLEDEKKKELDSKYRDRAKERREGKANEDPTQDISTTADYRAVAPEVKVGTTQAEKRKKIIEESKFLGGDMEHTHLVKGLDYALLDKVRAEITSKETHDEDLEAVIENPEDVELDEEEGEEAELSGRLAKSVYKVLFKNKLPQKNDMFVPGRMAYVVDLEDDFPESDIPTTAIRSKADCPAAPETATLTTNDIVINKLTQILSYLRQGRRDKKKRKEKEKANEAATKELMKPKDDIDIFEDKYTAANTGASDKGRDRSAREEKHRPSDRHRGDNRDRHDRGRDRRDDRDDKNDRKRSYFDKPVERSDMDMTTEKDRKESTSQFIKGLSKQYEQKWNEIDSKKTKEDGKSSKKSGKKKPEVDSYAECYPGMDEAADAIDDSDEEADYTKMDMGNKKGPVNRWDFENDEQYQEYMSKKEALPKAAFQYGVKMSDGRKTRRAGPKDEKAALDREWQKIQNIMSKRSGESASKRPKY
ncbi:protein Red-like [Watersipora subatra]|uniref:protein Red-like n=1 Tax=Watersipora subatra TaxID=2589382 RepID=UPI00355ADCA8